jgi:hypothetical protein
MTVGVSTTSESPRGATMLNAAPDPVALGNQA